jgi:hypothetical protein
MPAPVASRTFEQHRDDIARLARLFAANRAAYHAPGYKEAHVRMEFIDPLFMALGWDVRNEAGAAPQYREVVPEPSLDVEGQARAPDFTKPADKAAHDRMVSLVERMLELHRQLAGCRGECDKPAIERLIASTDAEIDRLAYELYGLTEEEIGIVEQ